MFPRFYRVLIGYDENNFYIKFSLIPDNVNTLIKILKTTPSFSVIYLIAVFQVKNVTQQKQNQRLFL